MRKHIDRLDKQYVKICSYAGATVLVTAVAFTLLWAASPVFAEAWGLVRAVIEPMVYGAALSYVLNPLVKFVSHRLTKFKRYANDPMRRRGAAVIISLVIVALALLLVLAVILLMVTHSIASLRWGAIMAFVEEMRDSFSDFFVQVEERLEGLGLFSGAGGESTVIDFFTGVTDFVTTMLFAIIFCVYFLIDGPRISAYGMRVIRAVMGDRPTWDISGLLIDADRVFSGYFRGQGIDAAMVGALSGIALAAVGVPYAPVIGLLTGLGNLIPYLGGPVGFGSVALMCLPEGDWVKMLIGFAVMGIVMFVDGNILNPRLLSESVEVHPMLVVMALIAGGAVGGLAGMLVAVPAAAFLKIQLDRWLEKRETSMSAPKNEKEEK